MRDKKNLILKYKNIPVLKLEIELGSYDAYYISKVIEIYSKKHFPVGIDPDNIDEEDFSRWWRKRFISKNRENIKELVRSNDGHYPLEVLMFIGRGLSLSDHYWVCKVKDKTKWEDINFFTNAFPKEIGRRTLGEKKYPHNYIHQTSDWKNSSLDVDNLDFETPDVTTDGQSRKKWDIINGKRCLIKASGVLSQGAYNEVFASRILEVLEIPHVKYELSKKKDSHNCHYSVCECFISPDTEFVPAWLAMKVLPKAHGVSFLDHYLVCCEHLGIPKEETQAYIDKMIVFDYLAFNVSRHFANFGLIRDANTMKIIGHAPLFDNGDSFFARAMTGHIRAKSFHDNPDDFGNATCQTFAKSHSEQIKLVSSFDWLNLDKIKDLDKEFIKMTKNSIHLEEDKRAEVIASAFNNRISKLELIIRNCSKITSDFE